MSTQKRFISEEEAYAILDRGSYGVLSTVSPDGQPYGIAVNYCCSEEEKCIFFHCAKEGRKLNHISENSRVAFLVVGPNEVIPEKLTTRFESVSVEGDAHIVSDENEKREILLAICRKFAPNKENIDDIITKSSAATAVVKINIQKISGKRNRG
jgi:nitroimidazol reductase NimA-like FMN-containing flavoprotein (pyridoxamine 5'-phosphate oxidase superfamily)